MGVFRTLSASATGDPVPATVVDSPAVTPDSLDPRSWCALVGLEPAGGAGGLVWQAAPNASTIGGMRAVVESADAPGSDKRSARNHTGLADGWGVFDADGLDGETLGGGEITVLDLSGPADAPMNAVVRGAGEALYRARVDEAMSRLPWPLVDEAHAFFDGGADGTLRLLLTRGRAPGVSLVLATQRPSAVPAVGISQADLLVSHRLTARADLDSRERNRPT